MLGNWSLGDYFKKEQLEWNWKFLTEELGLDKNKLHITLYEGSEFVPKDTESYEIWKNLGVPEDRIHFYGEKNWWSRSGAPSNMPSGEPGGPDSEVFYEFTQIEHDKKFGKKCHPNCDCGRFMEICNSVFIQYKKKEDGTLEELSQKNVDFGGGLERITAAIDNNPDVFQTDLYVPIIRIIEQQTKEKYEDNAEPMRVVADHLKAATFLIIDGVIPSNKLQGYILRRLLRRSAVKMRHFSGKVNPEEFALMIRIILTTYDGLFGINKNQTEMVEKVVKDEIERFNKTLDHGLKEIEKIEKIDGKKAFDLYQTFGFPVELTEELFKEKGQIVDREQFRAEFEKHRELSRTASAGMFKGGLADHSETVTKYHTATHLLHQALRDVLGPQVFQKGSNITSERLRFDFSYDKKMTPEEIKKVEEIINKRIKQDLKVDHMIVPLNEAKQMNAIGLFDEKYADKVSIYGVGPGFNLDPDVLDQRNRGGYYSLEFCGGPHVDFTGKLKQVTIVKQENLGIGQKRIYARVGE